MRAAATVMRQMEQMRMQIEILPDGQFGIEREALRHIADARAALLRTAIDLLAEQQGLAGCRRQKARQHFHRRRLAAAVRADEAEDLAALDREIDMIDGGESRRSFG